MSSLAEALLDDFGAAVGQADLSRYPWFLIPGKAGPNAVFKIVVPNAGGCEGYVLTAARHPDTPVIRHEVDILDRLRRRLPNHLLRSVPNIVAHGQCAGIPYFGTPFYRSQGYRRIERRLARRRIWAWIEPWLIQLAQATRGGSLSPEWLESEFGDTLSRIEADSTVDPKIKRRLREQFDMIVGAAAQIPSVCCHGDMWSENVMWRPGGAGAVVLDWGAARWPGLPAVDLCRYGLRNAPSVGAVAESVRAYCNAIDLDAGFVPALYDLYNVFIQAELDHAYASQPTQKTAMFANGLPSEPLSAAMKLGVPQPALVGGV